jgi:hypothetical protein
LTAIRSEDLLGLGGFEFNSIFSLYSICSLIPNISPPIVSSFKQSKQEFAFAEPIFITHVKHIGCPQFNIAKGISVKLDSQFGQQSPDDIVVRYSEHVLRL